MYSHFLRDFAVAQFYLPFFHDSSYAFVDCTNKFLGGVVVTLFNLHRVIHTVDCYAEPSAIVAWSRYTNCECIASQPDRIPIDLIDLYAAAKPSRNRSTCCRGAGPSMRYWEVSDRNRFPTC